MTPEERLRHDIVSGVLRRVRDMMRFGDANLPRAKVVSDEANNIADEVMGELRVRWTVVERPRSQRTLRQET